MPQGSFMELDMGSDFPDLCGLSRWLLAKGVRRKDAWEAPENGLENGRQSPTHIMLGSHIASNNLQRMLVEF